MTRMPRHAILLTILLSALFAAPVCAQDAHQQAIDEPPDTTLELDTDLPWEFTGLRFYFDNDGSRFVKPWQDSDQHYTNGVKLELTWKPRLNDEWRRWVTPAGPWHDADLAAGFVLTHHIYTPQDIRLSTPPLTDRPYAAYLYAGVFLQRATETTHEHLELDLGVVGPAAMGQETQTFIHAVMPNQYKPRGWDTQLSNELAVNVRYGRSWRSERADLGGIELDAIPRIGFDLGNVFTRANADLTLRLGLGLPDDFGPGRLLDYHDATPGRGGGWGADREWNVYAYTRLGARAVARNIFLDGNTFQNSRSVDKKHFVGEVEVGLRTRFGQWELGYSITWLSEEYKTQPGVESFGSWFVALRF